MGAILLELALGGWDWLKSGLRFAGKILKSLNAQGVIGLIVALALTFVAFGQWSSARHWKKQSGQFEKLYRADEASFQRIAQKANALKVKTDALTVKISAALKERHNEEVASNAADAAALRVSGPGKAACPGNSGPATSASGHVQAAAPSNAALDKVPDRAGTVLIAMPFDDAIDFAKSHDDLRSEVKTWRDDDTELRKAWPKSSK